MARLTCREPCTKTADALYHRFQATCDCADFEDSITRPNGVIPFLKWMSVFFYISLAFLWLKLPQIGLPFGYLLGYEVIDRFAQDAIARNVYAVLDSRR
jgi:hypothetical protein